MLDQLRAQGAHGGVLLPAVAVGHDDHGGKAVAPGGKATLWP